MDYDVRAIGDTRSILLTPAGTAFEVDMSRAELSRLIATWQTLDPSERDALAPELIALGAMLEAEGVFSSPSPPIGCVRWVIAGDGVLCSILSQYVEFVGHCCEPREATVAAHKDSSDTMVLAAFDTFRPEALKVAQTAAFDQGLAFTYIYASANRYFAGPHMRPGCTPAVSDVLGRMAMCSPLGLDLVREGSGPASRARRGSDWWAVATLVKDAEAWFSGAPSAASFGLMELTSEPPAVIRHPLLPLPSSEISVQAAATELRRSQTQLDLRSLVDRKVGVVIYDRQIEHEPGGPPGLATYQALAANLNAIYPWRNSRICGGSAFYDSERARNAAVAEAVERYCLNYVDQAALHTDSYRNLTVAGFSAVHPDDWVLFAESQYARANFPFVQPTEDTVMSWTEVTDIHDGTRTLVPAGLVYGNFYVGPLRKEVRIAYHAFAGIAAGRDVDDAMFGGLREIVERDATMIWWLNGGALPKVDFSCADPELWDWCERAASNRTWVLSLPNVVGMPVMCAVIKNTEEQLLNVGFGAHPDAIEAVRKSISEAIILQEGSRDMLLGADSLFQQAADRGMMTDYWFKPWSSERAYLRQFSSDFSDVGDLMVQQQLYLDPEAQARALEILEPRDQIDIRSFGGPEAHAHTGQDLAAQLQAEGFRVLMADLTTIDAHLAEVAVVRMLVPGMVPNTPAGFPPLGTDRILRMGREWGLSTQGSTKWRPNLVPLPHA